MANEETILEEEEVEETYEDEVEEVDDTDTDEAEETDDSDEYEYDEAGNVILEDDAAEEEADEETEEGKAAEDTEEESKPKEDGETAALRKKYADLEAQVKDTLSKLGIDSTGDSIQGLLTIAAEAEGKSVEEYTKELTERKKSEEAQALLKAQAFEKMAAADLAELHAAYPETLVYKHVMDMPEELFREFANYRDMGLSAKKAYAAANPDGIRSTVASSVKKADTKGHLRSAVTKGAHSVKPQITKSVMEEWRTMFPRMSDKEIVRLYQKTY